MDVTGPLLTQILDFSLKILAQNSLCSLQEPGSYFYETSTGDVSGPQRRDRWSKAAGKERDQSSRMLAMTKAE